MVVRRQSDAPADALLRPAMRRRNVTFAHLLEALQTLEPELIRLATERCDSADIETLHEIVDAPERSLDRFDQWSELEQRFHLAIAEMSAKPDHCAAHATLRQFMNSRTLNEHATRYHHRILFEIESRDPELAAAVVGRHVNDFRVAWEKAGLDLNMHVMDLEELPPKP
jgi:DNA-binding FadR family transcriptional regulator